MRLCHPTLSKTLRVWASHFAPGLRFPLVKWSFSDCALNPTPLSEFIRGSLQRVGFRPQNGVLPAKAVINLSGVWGRVKGGGGLAPRRGRWVEVTRIGGRQTQARSGRRPQPASPFPSSPPPCGHSGPPPPQLGQEPPHSHSRPRARRVPQPLPEPAEGHQQHASEGELSLSLFTLCSLSRERASPHPWPPAGKLWKLIRRCQERKRELYKWPNY